MALLNISLVGVSLQVYINIYIAVAPLFRGHHSRSSASIYP